MAAEAARALLLGTDHDRLGEIAVRSVTPRLVVALSAGRFRKGYAHLDPNEDAVLAAASGDRALLAVADGHSGFDAAEAAAGALAAEAPALLHLADRPESAVRRGFELAQAAVAAAAAGWCGERAGSRTTLTVCVVGGGRAAAGTLGDSACLHLGRRRPRVLGRPGPFLDAAVEWDPGRGQSVRMRAGDRLCVVSDGVSTFLVPPWERRAGALLGEAGTPEDAARSLVGGAWDGGAGDNLAAAVWFG